MRDVMELRVSELAPARSHADVACEGMRTTTLGAWLLQCCTHGHAEHREREREPESDCRCAHARAACTLSDTYNGAPHKLLCPLRYRFGVATRSYQHTAVSV